MPTTLPSDTLAAAADAYVWGYPLVVMHRTRALHCSRVPLGRLNHRSDLATPASRSVVAPNNDTLYSSGWFDLRAGDLVLEVPPMDDPRRYWSVMVLDAYTNVSYVCRRTHGAGGATVRLTLDPATETPRDATDVLPVATATAWILGRVLVEGPHDLEAAHAIQQGIVVHTPSGHPDGLTIAGGRPNEVHTAGAEFFAELAAAIAVDPPAVWHPQPVPAVRHVIDDPASLTDDERAEAVARGEQQVAGRGLGTDKTANGWGTRTRGSDFGDDVLTRAACAKFVLAGHHPVENRSYIARADASGATLDGDRGVVLRFPKDGGPPCTGFWSLTVYGPDMFLVDNAIDRYSIGDRTPGLLRDSDGSLSITIGGPHPDDVSNWLPAPSGGYGLGLRVYEGGPEVVDATWFPPALVPSAPA